MKKSLIVIFVVLCLSLLLISSCSHTHKYGEWSTIKSASCTEKGLEERKCSCGEKETREILSTNHKYKDGVCIYCGEKWCGLEIEISHDNDCVTVKGIGTYEGTNVIIPDKYENLPITHIGKKAFEYSNITSVIMPNTITKVEEDAFYDCCNLTNITIPNSVTFIGNGAFTSCNSLKYNEYENGKYLGNNGNKYLVLYGVIDKDVDFFEINHSTTFIYNNALYDCENIKTLILPSKIISIGEYAFGKCYKLSKIEIPPSVVKIGTNAFFGCDELVDIKIEDNPIFYMDGNCIIDRTKKEIICGFNNSTIPSDGSVISIGNFAFAGRDGIKDITIPNTIENIGVSAFWRCSGLIDVYIPNSVLSMGESAFYGCENLWRISISNGITIIEPDTFGLCENLGIVEIPNSVISIGERAFEFCSNLRNITIPDSVLDIGKNAFESCVDLNSIVLSKNITSIHESTFYKCSNITSITIPENVTIIEGGAFYSCSKLWNIVIQENLMTIGDCAFSKCDKLQIVFYTGTYDQFEKITIGKDNAPFENAKKKCGYIME